MEKVKACPKKTALIYPNFLWNTLWITRPRSPQTRASRGLEHNAC